MLRGPLDLSGRLDHRCWRPEPPHWSGAPPLAKYRRWLNTVVGWNTVSRQEDRSVGEQDRLQAALKVVDLVEVTFQGFGQPAFHLTTGVALREVAPQVEEAVLHIGGRYRALVAQLTAPLRNECFHRPCSYLLIDFLGFSHNDYSVDLPRNLPVALVTLFME
jgi:hypothetical protein